MIVALDESNVPAVKRAGVEFSSNPTARTIYLGSHFWRPPSRLEARATIPPLTTLGLFIEQSLSADGACQDAVARHLSARSARDESRCSLNTEPYCRARQRLPTSLIEQLRVTVGECLEQAAPYKWRWRGRSVKLFDGMTVSMPDTEANQAAFPQSGEQKPGLGFPVAQLVALISLSTGAVLGLAMGFTRGKGSGEQALFRELMPQLDGGDVILVDRYHCTYFTIAMLIWWHQTLITTAGCRTPRNCLRTPVMNLPIEAPG